MAVDPIYQSAMTPDGELYFVTPEYAMYALGDSLRPSGQWLAGALQQQQQLKQGISAAYSAVADKTLPRGIDAASAEQGAQRNPFAASSLRGKQQFPRFSFGSKK